MKTRIAVLRMLSWIPLLVLALLPLVSCSIDESSDRDFYLVAEVDLNAANSSMAAVVECIPDDSFFPIMDSSATVTVNDEDVPPGFFGYMTSTLTPVGVGDPVEFHFAFEGADFRKTLNMPAKPVLITDDGDAFDPTQPITITWNEVMPTPGTIAISISGTYTQDGEVYSDTTSSGDDTSITIPADTLKALDAIPVVIEAAELYVSSSDPRFTVSEYLLGNQADVIIDTIP